MYFANMFDLREWDPSAEYIVLDDIDIKFFPHWKFFLGCQKEGTLTDKYRKKQRVRNGKPSIWVCNGDYDPRRSVSRLDLNWLDLNCDFIEIREKLY